LIATETLRVLEDYKPLDVEWPRWGCPVPRHPRPYPEWRFLIDGDGGDENLKTSIEEIPS